MNEDHLLLIKGMILGFPVAIVPGAFLDLLIAEARRRGFAACLTTLLARLLIEAPLFVVLTLGACVAPALSPQSPLSLAIVGCTLGLWGWYLIDHPSHLSLRMDATYERLRADRPTSALVHLFSVFWRSPWWWVLWLVVGLRMSVEVIASVPLESRSWSVALEPMWWQRTALLAVGYYIPAIVGALWVSLSLLQRARHRQGDFFILPNRPYRMVVSLGGMFLMFLAFDYVVRGLGQVLEYKQWSILG